MTNLSEDSLSSGQDLNLGQTEYRVGVHPHTSTSSQNTIKRKNTNLKLSRHMAISVTVHCWYYCNQQVQSCMCVLMLISQRHNRITK
jgi:hypothetical protein